MRFHMEELLLNLNRAHKTQLWKRVREEEEEEKRRKKNRFNIGQSQNHIQLNNLFML